ncbi:MAG: nitroreductase family protein [Armatimonadetes bacterium]|nr:nitroreductase family protein [Armatimonadota bacterium]
MEIREALRTRRSIRAYTDQPVAREVIEDIVDCARWTPSGSNVQPWTFIVVTDAEMRQRLAELNTYGKFIAQAPACIVIVCQDTRYYLEDGSSAAFAVTLAAWSHGLGTCWVAGDKKATAPEMMRLLGVPDTHRLVALVAVGYPAETPVREKKPLEGLLRWEKF